VVAFGLAAFRRGEIVPKFGWGAVNPQVRPWASTFVPLRVLEGLIPTKRWLRSWRYGCALMASARWEGQLPLFHGSLATID